MQAKSMIDATKNNACIIDAHLHQRCGGHKSFHGTSQVFNLFVELIVFQYVIVNNCDLKTAFYIGLLEW